LDRPTHAVPTEHLAGQGSRPETSGDPIVEPIESMTSSSFSNCSRPAASFALMCFSSARISGDVPSGIARSSSCSSVLRAARLGLQRVQMLAFAPSHTRQT
jgi:hypothetical protein